MELLLEDVMENIKRIRIKKKIKFYAQLLQQVFNTPFTIIIVLDKIYKFLINLVWNKHKINILLLFTVGFLLNE